MLGLNSPRWRDLAHAFGSAEDIPRLLDALATMDGERERAELWFGVWETLAPEERAVTASYAAVPHVLVIGDARGAAELVTSLHITATIEMNRHRPDAPAIPPDLLESYADAIESLPRRVMSLVDQPWDAYPAQILSAVLLVGKRQPALARALFTLGGDSG